MTATQLDAFKPQIHDLLEAIRWVEDAMSTIDVGLEMYSSFLIAGGYIHATNGRMVAAAPFAFTGTVLVPAAPFAKLLRNKPDGEFTWVLDDQKLTLKRGRFRGSVKLLPPEQWVYPVYTADFLPLPAVLTQSLRVLLPFCSENATQPWATCLCLREGYMHATNNVSLARSSLGTDHSRLPGSDLLIPRWVAQFIVDREDGLTGWEWGENHITFQWSNGAWMRSSLINAQFPNVSPMIASCFETAEPAFMITKAWVQCVRRVGKIAEDPVIRLRRTGVLGRTGEVMEVEDEAETPCPDGLEETVWDLRFLDPVFDAATHWNPMAYPQPATFRGPLVEGIVLGRRE